MNTAASLRVQQPTSYQDVGVWKGFGAVESGRGLLLAAVQGAGSQGWSQRLVTGADGRKDAGGTQRWKGTDPTEWGTSARRAFPHSLSGANLGSSCPYVGTRVPIQMFRGGLVMCVCVCCAVGRVLEERESVRTCMQPPNQPIPRRGLREIPFRDRHQFRKFKWKAYLEIAVNYSFFKKLSFLFFAGS